MKLTDLGEKKIIQKLKRILDIGDDAAIFNYQGTNLILTTDFLYKETHILPEMSWEQIGKLVVTVNFSDIAAMGAKPLAFLLSLGMPDEEFSSLEALIRGAKYQAKKYQGKFVGGDTNQNPALSLAGFALGESENPTLRSTAQPGDVIVVTGKLGEGSLGIKLLLENSPQKENYPQLIKKALEPQPRVGEGQKISSWASSLTDVSDSLAVSLHEIAKESNVGFKVDLNQLPISSEAQELAKTLNLDILKFVLYRGWDYELLATLSPQKFSQISKNDKIPLTRIGHITKDEKTTIGFKGEHKISIPQEGYEHFKN